jgi:hypothetical protein
MTSGDIENCLLDLNKRRYCRLSDVYAMKIKMSKESRYYQISDDYIHGGAVGWKFVNSRTVQPAGVYPFPVWWPGAPWRVPEFAETPRFLIDRKLGRAPRDLESMDGVFFVSLAMKAVLEAVDPDACAFVRCETVLPSGEPGRETWLCAITRAFARAVDEKASVKLFISRGPDGSPIYAMRSDTRLHFIPEIVGNAPLFHIAETPRDIFCDQSVKDACKAAGLKGILFQPISK